jgi:hypothetical protein
MTKTSRIVLIVLATVLVLLAVITVAGLSIVNNRAEAEFTRNVDETLRASGLTETVTYDSIDVRAGRGTVRILGLRMEDPSQPVHIRAGSVSFRVSPSEALGLVQNPERAELSRAKITLEAMEMAVPVNTTSLSMDSAELEVTGRLSQHLAGANPQLLLRQLDTVGLQADGIVFTPDPEMLAQLQRQGSPDWIADEKNHAIETIDFSSVVSPERIEITRFDIAAPFLTASGSSSLKLDETMRPTTESLEYRIEEMAPELRNQFSMIASMMGATVPEEGPFSFVYDLDETGTPRFSIE